MLVDCLTAGIPVDLLTPEVINSCRERIACCILNNNVPTLQHSNIGLCTHTAATPPQNWTPTCNGPYEHEKDNVPYIDITEPTTLDPQPVLYICLYLLSLGFIRYKLLDHEYFPGITRGIGHYAVSKR